MNSVLDTMAALVMDLQWRKHELIYQVLKAAQGSKKQAALRSCMLLMEQELEQAEAALNAHLAKMRAARALMDGPAPKD